MGARMHFLPDLRTPEFVGSDKSEALTGGVRALPGGAAGSPRWAWGSGKRCTEFPRVLCGALPGTARFPFKEEKTSLKIKKYSAQVPIERPV